MSHSTREAYSSSPPGSGAPPAGSAGNGKALGVLTTLFFMMGFITALNDLLVPHLKEVFTLSYTEALLIQFCFFTAYAVMSVFSGRFIQRFGYKNGVIGGFLVAALGCILFFPAAALKTYPLFLGALFILASGITLLQVSGNPYVTLLSKPGKESSTLTLVQAFNSLGTTLAPGLGALFILSVAILTPEQQSALGPAELAAYQSSQAASVQVPYLGLAAILIVLALSVFFIKLPDAAKVAEQTSEHHHDGKTSVWQYPHLLLGAGGIFCYVGAEVAIGSLLVNLMALPEVAGLSHNDGAKMLTFYWGGAMVGRFLGSYMLSCFRPGNCLAFNAVMNVLLIGTAIAAGGKTAMYTLIAVGFFNSIMFPTIFSLATRGLGRFTGAASGLLCTAIVGGAIIPLVQGLLADTATIGLLPSFVIPAVCYVYIAYFGLKGHKEGMAD